MKEKPGREETEQNAADGKKADGKKTGGKKADGKKAGERKAASPKAERGTLGQKVPFSAEDLKRLCMELGAEDVGFVEIGREELGGEKSWAEQALPGAKTYISFVCRVGRANMRSPMRSVANLEFHHTADLVNEVGRSIVHALERRGIRAINPAHGFPMEADRWPGRLWVVSHKLIAQEAGMGVMGIHRLVIHPRFGNHVLLGTVLMDAEVDQVDRPLSFQPCLECKLCVAACPTGAVKADGHFDFSACYTHNYREFMGGFQNWVEGIASSRNPKAYRKKFSDAETVSMWQSLGFGPNYKAAYCMSVCPAGEDVIAPYLADKKGYAREVLQPFQEKREVVYVTKGSDAEVSVPKRFPRKTVRVVGSGLLPKDAESFFTALPWLFQRKQAEGLSCVYHFSLRAKDRQWHRRTITIRDQQLRVEEGLQGKPNLRVLAREAAWIGFLRKERSLLRGLLTLGIRVLGDPRLLLRFGRCFPS